MNHLKFDLAMLDPNCLFFHFVSFFLKTKLAIIPNPRDTRVSLSVDSCRGGE